MKHLAQILDDANSNDWSETWRLLCGNNWFESKLAQTSSWVLRQAGLPATWRDDVQQEASLLVARILMRKPSMGFDAKKGKAEAFVGTILYRCCQKGMRQFRNSMHHSIDTESLHPSYETTARIDDGIDLRDCINGLAEPLRSTTEQTLQGDSINRIANATNRSPRTIYRYIEQATAELREQLRID